MKVFAEKNYSVVLNNEEEDNSAQQYHSKVGNIHNITYTQKKLLTIHLDENIMPPNYYRAVVDEMMRLTEDDVVQILINSHGGDYYGMLSIIESIRNTDADVLAVITGMAASAASIIALSCPKMIVCDGATMMIHSLSYGTFGKESDVRSYTQFMTKQTDKVIRQTYEGFLNKKEIEEVIQGREIWLDAEEIRERANNKEKYLLNLEKKQTREIKKKVKQLAESSNNSEAVENTEK